MRISILNKIKRKISNLAYTFNIYRAYKKGIKDSIEEAKKNVTIVSNGFWFEAERKSESIIVIKPKEYSGESWIGAIMSDGSYLEKNATIEFNIDFNSLDKLDFPDCVVFLDEYKDL